MLTHAILYDQIRYLRYLTVRKVANAVHVLAGYFLSKITGNVHTGQSPLSLSIEPTTSCNLRCPECPSGLRAFSRPTGMLSPSLYEKLIDQVKVHVTYLNLYFQGEPFLHPEFLHLVKYAHANKIYTATSTNAHFIDSDCARQIVQSGLDRLIVSIDGTTQETYSQYRVGGKLKKVLQGTQNVIEWKRKLKSSTPHVIFQYLVVAPNEHQIEEVQQLAHTLGVDEVRFKTAQVYDYENGNPLIPADTKYSRYVRKHDGSYKIKNTLENHCWRLWSSAVITWDGKMVPCCFDKDAKYTMGDLSQDAFSHVWKSDEYNHFRKQVLQSRSNIDICANCSEGTRVWA